MPFYEYHCSACGHELEALQKISDKPLIKCPECGKAKLDKLVSAPSFQLKGSGWYASDYKSKPKEKKEEKKEPAKSDKPAKKDKAKEE